MPETVFWDTVAFVALGNARDELHQAAVHISQELAQAKAQVLTTDAVHSENERRVATSDRFQRQRLIHWVDKIKPLHCQLKSVIFSEIHLAFPSQIG